MEHDCVRPNARQWDLERLQQGNEKHDLEFQDEPRKTVQDFEGAAADGVVASTPYPDIPMVPGPPLEWAEEPDFALPGEWLSMTSISPSMMSRHWMVLGETGSGKTKSVILPLLNSLLEYELQTSMLVIDPKNELHGYLSAKLRHRREEKRLEELSEKSRLYYFEGQSNLSITDRMDKLFKLKSLYSDCHLGDNTIWVDLAKAFIMEFILAEQDYGQATQGKCLADEILRELSLRHQDKMATLGGSYFGKIMAIIDHARLSVTKLKQAARIVQKLLNSAQLPINTLQTFNNYTATDELIQQFNHVAATATPLLSELANPELTRLVEFSPFAFGGPDMLSVRDVVEQGKVLLVTPGPVATKSADMLGKTVKTKFFQMAQCRENKQRPVAYVCDEFQRFVTADPDSGEQSFLDRCRAHRVSCILATQSLASITYALHETPGAAAAMDVILNNTANKIYFRNTDMFTTSTMQNLFPDPTLGGGSVIRVRPPSTLRVGEAYYLLSNGQWGRAQLPLFA